MAAIVCGTKKALAQHCRAIVARSIDFALLQGDDADFVGELFQHHPDYLEKSGSGVAGFSVQPDSTWGTSRHFVVVRTDGSRIDFSWIKCINGQAPNPIALAAGTSLRSLPHSSIGLGKLSFGRRVIFPLFVPSLGEAKFSKPCGTRLLIR